MLDVVEVVEDVGRRRAVLRFQAPHVVDELADGFGGSAVGRPPPLPERREMKRRLVALGNAG